MHIRFYKLLFLLALFPLNAVIAENKGDLKASESSQLDQIREALDEFTRLDTKNNLIYEQRRREMLDSVEVRFYACDPDNDNTLDVYETTVCLPQVARQFRQVDINNDNVISLDELSILARDFAEKRRSIDSAIVKDLNTNKNIISSEKKDEVIKESPL